MAGIVHPGWLVFRILFGAVILIAVIGAVSARAGPGPVQVVTAIYGDLDNSDRLPGGEVSWSARVVQIWGEMWERRQVMGLSERPAFPRIIGADPVREISVTLLDASDDAAEVRGSWATADRSVAMVFALVHEGGEWRVDEAWREGSTDPAERLTGLLARMPLEGDE